MGADGRADRRAGVREGRGAASVEYSFGYEAVALKTRREGFDLGLFTPAGGCALRAHHYPALRRREALRGSVCSSMHMAHRLALAQGLQRAIEVLFFVTFRLIGPLQVQTRALGPRGTARKTGPGHAG